MSDIEEDNEDAEENDLKKMSMIIPDTISSLDSDLNIIIKKNEDIIKRYIERVIYNSTLSYEIKIKLDEIFEEVREKFKLEFS